MPNIKQLSRVVSKSGLIKPNWYPGHMYAGMQAMVGKLNTVDCIVEVHDARIPFTGRNPELKRQLGGIKPRLLVLNKSDLADLSRWESVKDRLYREGDRDVLLTDLSGSTFSFSTRGYHTLMDEVMKLINKSDRHNRQMIKFFKIMIVGIPNVGKSSLINRLRQQHVGKKGEAVKVGSEAGVTRHVNNLVKVCTRPAVYSFDTPGVLEPKYTKDRDQSMRLALCSSISDKVLDPMDLAGYLLNYLNVEENYTYVNQFGLDKPVSCLDELLASTQIRNTMMHTVRANSTSDLSSKPNQDRICWHFIKQFRKGFFGKVMFD